MDGVPVSIRNPSGLPAGRLPSGAQVAPALRVEANSVAVLREPSVTGKSSDEVEPPTITKPEGSVAIAVTLSRPLPPKMRLNWSGDCARAGAAIRSTSE